jgi:UDP-GlcNAc3NAcA epimerase
MYDANLRFGPIARERSFALTHSEVVPGRYVLATVHRETNVAPEPLARIVEGLGRLDEPVVFPAHPRTRAALADLDVPIPGNVRLRPPAGYLDFAALASQARVVATDSGGVQKEAYWFGVPCVTLRERTEWVETIETGWNTLTGADADAITKAIERAGPGHYHPPLYGDGQAAERIARLLYTISE